MIRTDIVYFKSISEAERVLSGYLDQYDLFIRDGFVVAVKKQK